MMKKIIILLLIFQFNALFAQKTLEQIINELPQDEFYSSTSGYFDEAGEKQGLSIQNELQVLERLRLEPIEYGEYYLTGKYAVNNLTVLFLSNYLENEDFHFAILLDTLFNIIDRLDEVAYSNAEGFYSVYTFIEYNIVRTTTYNTYQNPKYTNKKYTITDDGFKPIVDQVIVHVPSGCRVYEEPAMNSHTVTWANYLEVFDYLSNDFEMDSILLSKEGSLINSWYEVAKEGTINQFGYISGTLAKRQISFTTNNYDVIVNEISKEEFQAEEVKKTSKPNEEKITEINEIKKRLGDQLILEYVDEYDYHEIKSIVADNGKEINLYWMDYGISAYFPKYHYLLLEGGHSLEYIINLKNGDNDIDRIGNPDYYLPSPKGTFRLNGYYSGQSNIHFLEQNTENGAPEYLFSFSSLLMLDFIETYFWKDDSTIFLKIENAYYSVEMQEIK